MYVICGSYGRGGTGSNGSAQTIASGRVTVPATCWKVVVVLPVGSNDARRVSVSMRVIAVSVPNVNTVATTWGGYRTSVDAIEAATGYDLLSAVPASVQAQLEGKTDTGPTNW